MGADDAASTRVYYHLDESTPYMSVVPVPVHAITLGDFKKVFGRRGYDYFCKKFDDALNVEVKEALTSDSQRLHKSANGHVELFLFSQSANGNGNEVTAVVAAGHSSIGTLPRPRHATPHASTMVGGGVPKWSNRRSSALALSSIVDELDVGGGQRVSMVTNERSMSGEASSDINTLISKRAGEHLADIYTSTSEDPYKYDITSIPSFTSSHLVLPHHSLINRTLLRDGAGDEDGDDGSSVFYTNSNPHHSQQQHQRYRQRKPRKQKYRKAYVPSTISSASESSLSTSLPRVDEVKVPMQDGLELGISVACNDGCIFISRIEPGSAAEKCGRLEVGDQIVQVGKTSFETLSDEEAINEIRKVCRAKKPIKIYVAKRPRVSDQKSDALSLLCETLQMNVSEWVEQTTKQGIDPPFEEFSLAANSANGHATSSSGRGGAIFPTGLLRAKDGAETSDEERAAYADRRNGVGSMLVPALQQSKKRAAAAIQPPMTVASMQPPLGQPPIYPGHHYQPLAPQRLTAQLGAPAAVAGMAMGDHRVSPLPLQSVDAMEVIGEPSHGDVVFHHRQIAAATAGYWNNGGVGDLLKKDSLHVQMDSAIILWQMARPDSGLTIKDRKWLKIPVPNSFIGDEMVSWLLEHVDGFRDRKAARAYASKLLANGYIKHVVNMAHFNEKCYYIFDDAIINTHLRLLLQPQPNSQSTLISNTNTTSTRVGSHNGPPLPANGSNNPNGTATMKAVPESTTEITYIGSAASPFFLAGQPLPSGMVGHTGKNTIIRPQMSGGVGAENGQSHAIVEMATNPRYVSPPAHFIRDGGVDKSRLADANNNNLIDPTSKKTAATAKDAAGRPLTSRVLNGVWPISPIPVHHTNNGSNSLRDCDSPAMTNEYASVIQGEVNSGAQFDTFDTKVVGHGREPKENNPPPPAGRLPLIPPTLANGVGGGNSTNLAASYQFYTQSQQPQQQPSQNPFMRNLCGH